MKTKLLALAFLAGGSMFAQTRFSIGIQIGGHGSGYYEPPPVYAARPPCPGPEFGWTDGYWAQDYGRSAWHDGYWTRRSYRYQAQPRYESDRYNGYGQQSYHRVDNHYRDRDREDNRGRFQQTDRRGDGYGGDGYGGDGYGGDGYEGTFRNR